MIQSKVIIVFVLSILFAIGSTKIKAQEKPFITHMYTADPSAHIWNDGRLYIYASHDVDLPLAEKGVLEKMSRGAVYALKRAAENHRKVSAVYIDNPLLDMKSWPCGLGQRSSSPDELTAFRKDCNITSDDQLRKFRNSPIDKVLQIVKG